MIFERSLYPDYPWMIHVETSVGCTRSCWFCPTEVSSISSVQTQDWTLTQRIAAELKAWSYDRYIAFNWRNEPLLDPDLPRRVALFRDTLPRAILTVKTNGDLLNEETLERLNEAGLDEVLVTVYDRDGRTRQRARELSQAYPSLVCLRYRETATTRTMRDRAGSACGSVEDQPKSAGCWSPFARLPIACNGTVGLCAEDWCLRHSPGSIREQPLSEIWNSEFLLKTRQMLLRSVCDNLPCATCRTHGWRPGCIESKQRLRVSSHHRLQDEAGRARASHNGFRGPTRIRAHQNLVKDKTFDYLGWHPSLAFRGHLFQDSSGNCFQSRGGLNPECDIHRDRGAAAENEHSLAPEILDPRYYERSDYPQLIQSCVASLWSNRIFLDVGGKCNLVCAHCLNHSSPRGDVVPMQVLLKFADRLAEIDAVEWWITGGEPTQHPAMKEVVMALAERHRTFVVTNGVDNLEVLEDLYACGLTGVHISLETDEETHARVRGNGNYQRTTKTVRALSLAGVFGTLSCTLYSWNIDRVSEAFEFAEYLGWDLQVAPVRQSGRASGNADYRELTEEELRTAFRTIRELRKLARRSMLRFCLDEAMLDNARPPWHGSEVLIPKRLVWRASFQEGQIE